MYILSRIFRSEKAARAYAARMRAWRNAQIVFVHNGYRVEYRTAPRFHH